MAAQLSLQAPHAANNDEVVRYLWMTKEWSDITIICNNAEEISVHRAVVCTRSKFFDSCCRLEFAEKTTGKISLTEESHVVNAILEFLYGVDVSLIQLAHAKLAQDESGEHLMMDLTRLYSAADKYSVFELQDPIVSAFGARMQTTEDAKSVLDIADFVYQNTPYFDVKLRSAALTHIQSRLDVIMAEEETSAKLLQIVELNTDLLRRVAPILRSQFQASNSESNETSPPTTPKKRKSPRIGTHTPGTYALRMRTSG